MEYGLFILCVLGFSVSSCFSGTAYTYLRDMNPRIWCWNWTLFCFAVILANYVRLPLGIDNPTLMWIANLGICLITGLAVFFAVLLCAMVHYIFWPMFKSLFYSGF